MILDANALMSPFRSRLRLEEELEGIFGSYEALVPRGVMRELRGLSASRREAKAALVLVKKRGWRTHGLPTDPRLPVDDEIILLARRLRAAVVTNDRALRAALRSKGVPVAFLRQRKRLVLEGAE